MRITRQIAGIALVLSLGMIAGQAGEASQWPKKTNYGWQCLSQSHCNDLAKQNSKTKVCRKKVKGNEWSSKYKYCLKPLWKGAPCNSGEQCATNACLDGRCGEAYAKEVTTHTAEDQTVPSLDDLSRLKNELTEELKQLKAELDNLRNNPTCHWQGHDRILITPRDFFQISGEEVKVHTNYYDRGGAVELHDNYDVIAQFTIPKNCIATEVAISLNEDCTGFGVYTSRLLYEKADKVFEPGSMGSIVVGSDIRSYTKPIGQAVIKPSQNLADTQFTTISTLIAPFDPVSNVLTVRIYDRDKKPRSKEEFFGVFGPVVDPLGLHTDAFNMFMSANYDEHNCDVSGGYIKLEPAGVESSSASGSKSNPSETSILATAKGKSAVIEVAKLPEPVKVIGVQEVVTTGGSIACGTGETFTLDCINQNACMKPEEPGFDWVVGKIHSPIVPKMFYGKDLSLGEDYAWWQNEANKCAIRSLEGQVAQGDYLEDPGFGKGPAATTCNFSASGMMWCQH